MAGLTTKETNKSADDLINAIDNASKQEDGRTLLKMMTDITGHAPKVWGDNGIIGFGKYTYTRKGSKKEYEWFHTGFAPRKTKMTVYLTLYLPDHEDTLKKLGKCTWGKGCLYINKLTDVDLNVLGELIRKSKDAKWHNG